MAEKGAEGRYFVGRKTEEDEEGFPVFDLTGDKAIEAFQNQDPGLYMVVKSDNLKELIAKCRISAMGGRSPYWNRETRGEQETRLGGRFISSISESWERQTIALHRSVDKLEARVNLLTEENQKLRDENWTLKRENEQLRDGEGEEIWESVLGRLIASFESKGAKEEIEKKLLAIQDQLSDKEKQAVGKAWMLAQQVELTEEDESGEKETVQ